MLLVRGQLRCERRKTRDEKLDRDERRETRDKRPETRDEREKKKRKTKRIKTSEHNGYKRKSDEKQVKRRSQERPEDKIYFWRIAKSSHNETYKKKPPK